MISFPEKRLLLSEVMNYPGGKFRLNIAINDDGATIITDYNDRYFVNSAIHWAAYGTGSTIQVVSQNLQIYGGAMLDAAHMLAIKPNSEYIFKINVLSVDGDSLVIFNRISNQNLQIIKEITHAGTYEFSHTDLTGISSIVLSCYKATIADITIYPVHRIKICEVTDMTIGSDNLDETILVPAGFSVTFNAEKKDMILLDRLMKSVPTNVSLEKYSSSENLWKPFQSGKIDMEDIAPDFPKNCLSIRCMDGFAMLKSGRSITPTFDNQKIVDYLKWIIGTDVVVVSDWKVTQWLDEYTSGDEFGFEHLYMNSICYQRDVNEFEIYGDIVKSILFNMASYGIVGRDGKFYLMPYFAADNCATTDLYVEDCAEFDTVLFKKFDGVKLLTNMGDGTYQEPSMGSVFPADSKGELEIKLPFSGTDVVLIQGNPDNNSLKTLFLDGSNKIYWQTVTYKKPDGTYSDPGTFYDHLTNLLVNNLQKDNIGYKITKSGVDYDPISFYKIKSRKPGIFDETKKYRIKMLKPDLTKNTSELLLIEC